MKFMQRSEDRARADAEKKIEKRRIDESHWRATYTDDVVAEGKPRARVVYETSYLKMPAGDTAVRGDGTTGYSSGDISDTIALGRRSFKSFNTRVEEESQESATQQRSEHAAQSEDSMAIDDSALAETLSNGTKASGTPASQQRERGSQTKRKRR
ncbi:hypothetical protein H4R20_001804 [Coemansia guatemalensis]|uniref:Uncharacterized protein n=1 Tax=Coemansia guatemalensis TaxID=2761395 RepID=A0A9W8LUL3_9FUNG|nr:hypothetical protein H4R20_001804 [Coemansia guatemalensis]